MSESRDPVQEPKENESAENAESNGDVTEVNVSADETIIDDALPVDETEAALNQAQQELDEWRARAYRSAADLENARRRHQRERDDLQKYGVEGLLKELLAVVDNLERALDHNAGGDALVEGVTMVLRQFTQVVGRVGATPFDPKGEEFDPQFHEAMSQIPMADVEPGTVVEVFQRGWKLHDRLVRPAMVVVASAPLSQAETEPQDAKNKAENYESEDSQSKDEASQASEG